jgi:hypothetical protein
MTSRASTPIATTTRTPKTREPVRMTLSTSPGRATLDGAWWPQSRDLQLELADLVDNFPTEVGRVYRVLYSRPDWDTSPRAITVARGRLKTGSYPRDDTHVIVLRMSTRTDLRLLVVPPGHPVGDQAMAVATNPANRWSAAHILAVGEFDGDPSDPDDHWHDQGDSWWQTPQEGPPSAR